MPVDRQPTSGSRDREITATRDVTVTAADVGEQTRPPVPSTIESVVL